MATLEKIWIKPGRGVALRSVDEAEAVAGSGLVDNADQGGRRQVTIIERENWEAMMGELDTQADPSVRRANFMVSGLSLKESRSRVLVIGEVRILIAGETKPCNQMDEALPGLREAMAPDWRGGAYGEVLQGGTARVGDEVSWLQ